MRKLIWQRCRNGTPSGVPFLVCFLFWRYENGNSRAKNKKFGQNIKRKFDVLPEILYTLSKMKNNYFKGDVL
jgi:hypothetical protein